MFTRRNTPETDLATLVAHELECERVVVEPDGPTFERAMRAARYALAQGVEARTAARWAVVRVTQHVTLSDRAKLV